MAKKLDKDLQYLLDRLEIEDCIYRYSRGVDRHDVDIIPTVYHKDGIDDHGYFLGNREEYVYWVNGVHEAARLAHLHHITSHLCEIKGNVAHTESYVMFTLRANDGSNDVMFGSGRYIDRLEKKNGKWAIMLRRTLTDSRFTGDGKMWTTHPGGYEHGRWDKQDVSYQRPLKLPAYVQKKLEERLKAEKAAQ